MSREKVMDIVAWLMTSVIFAIIAGFWVIIAGFWVGVVWRIARWVAT